MEQVKEIIIIFAITFMIQLPILIAINYFRRKHLLHKVNFIGVIAYCFVIIYLTMWPPVDNQPPVSWSQLSFNLIPFASIVKAYNHFYYMVGIRNIVGNFILLLPLAFLLNVRRFKSALLFGLFISLSIEVIQLLLTKTGMIHRRSFDVDDLLLNTAGFIFGYGVKRILGKAKRKKIHILAQGRGHNEMEG